MKLKIKKLHPDAIIPTRSNSTDSGLDLYSIEKCVLLPNERKLIGCGIAIELPDPTFMKSIKNTNGLDSLVMFIWEAQIRPRSGLAAKHGITIVNSPGTIDSSYRGEIKVILLNNGDNPFVINKGDRIAQMIVCPIIVPDVEEVDELSNTDRGEGGFGSTGS